MHLYQIAQKNPESVPMQKIKCQKGAGTKMHKCFVGFCLLLQSVSSKDNKSGIIKSMNISSWLSV